MRNVSPSNTEWMSGAPCKGYTKLFFEPDKKERTTERKLRIAKAMKLCSECVLREVCLEYALEHHESGIWGGTNERERNRLSRILVLNSR